MALWDTPDLAARCQLHARRPATDASMPLASWYAFLTEAQNDAFSDLFTRYPNLQYSAPVQLTTADGGKTYSFGLEQLPWFLTWSTVGDASWSAVGTPTRIAAAMVGADGVPLDLIGDNDVVAIEYTQRVLSFTGNGTKTWRFRFAKFSPYADQVMRLDDLTAGVQLAQVHINTMGAVPIFTVTSTTAVPATITNQDMGDGTYLVTAVVHNVNAANSIILYVQPSGGAAADQASFYIGAIQFSDQFAADPIRPMGHAEIYPSLAAVPDDPLVPGVDFLAEGSLIRIPANRARAFSAGPYARFVARPDTALDATHHPTLFPKTARMLLVWKALEYWAARPGSGASPVYFMRKYDEARTAIWTELATEYNRSGAEGFGSGYNRWWTLGDLGQR